MKFFKRNDKIAFAKHQQAFVSINLSSGKYHRLSASAYSFVSMLSDEVLSDEVLSDEVLSDEVLSDEVAINVNIDKAVNDAPLVRENLELLKREGFITPVGEASSPRKISEEACRLLRQEFSIECWGNISEVTSHLVGSVSSPGPASIP